MTWPNGASLTVGGVTKHTLTDFSLVIENRDYIGAPVMNENYIDIPGRSGLVDLTKAVTSVPIYSSRPIHILLSGTDADPGRWDATISKLRNFCHGKEMRVVFDNDPNWFWHGKAQIVDFEAMRSLGRFVLEIPYAYPFKAQADGNHTSSCAQIFPDTVSSLTYSFNPTTAMEMDKDQDSWDEPSVVEVVVSSLSGGRIQLDSGNSNLTITATGTYRLAQTMERKQEVNIKLIKTGVPNPAAAFNVTFLRCSL